MQSGMGVSERVRVLGAAAALVLFSALSACGGGGGGGNDNPPLEVSVSVDGVADASNPLTPGESTTIDVPSGANLVFGSQGETRWKPTATSSSFDVNSFTFTSKSLTVSSNAGGTLVIVFSNKTDESQQATLTIHVAPKEFQAVARVDGEIEGWSSSSVEADGSASQYEFLRRTVLLDAGGYGTENSSTPGVYSWQRLLYDAQDRYLGYVNTQDGTECLYDNPLVYVNYPLQVGKTWSGDATRNCNGSPLTYIQHYTRSVPAYERVTVPQGSHDALRIEGEAHTTVTSNDPIYSGYSYTWKSTCWWAVDLGRNVKCEHAYEFDDGTTRTVSEVMTSLTR
ncbi:MAG TPA: hypothetical protein VGQ91_18715 [Ideonella sp.]|jgi:hypothetical protein|nr:hypothetical protein [Ideonella sp.]